MSENDNLFFDALHLKEMKVFVHAKSDAVLLRVCTSHPDFTWYSLHREDFISLANYLADDAAEMQRAPTKEYDR
jgi:hypothetical protein